MRKLFSVGSLLLLFILSGAAFAQAAKQYVVQGKNDPVRITYHQNGLLKLQSQSAQATVNLRRDLYGCLRLYDSSEKRPRPSTTDVISIRVLDEVLRNNKFYLLLQISTGSGCNVQGMCGAGEEVAVYWFQFDALLKQEKFQNAHIVSCQQNIELGEYNGKQGDLMQLKLEMQNGRLVLNYIRHDYSRENNDKSYALVYDRAVPEQGLQIRETKTQK